MMDANYISERLHSMRQEISDLRVTTARYWSKNQHTALEKSAFALEPLTKPISAQTEKSRQALTQLRVFHIGFPQDRGCAGRSSEAVSSAERSALVPVPASHDCNFFHIATSPEFTLQNS